jgi:hypothetical protein
MGVGVDQAGKENGVAVVDREGVGRARDCRIGADRRDATLLVDQKRAVGDGRRVDRENPRRAETQRQ